MSRLKRILVNHFTGQLKTTSKASVQGLKGSSHDLTTPDFFPFQKTCRMSMWKTQEIFKMQKVVLSSFPHAHTPCNLLDAKLTKNIKTKGGQLGEYEIPEINCHL